MNTKTLLCLCVLSLLPLTAGWADEIGSGGYEPHWSYEGQDTWGELTGAEVTVKPPYPFADCGIGKVQSPVDLADSSQVRSLNGPSLQYKPAPLVIWNNGHTLQVNSPNGKLYIGQDAYELVQFHFHAPSEHVIGSTTFPMELHFLHGAANGKMAVVGVLLKEGRENQALQTILDHAPYTETIVTTDVMVNPRGLLPINRSRFYTYAGSLTTPPCSEGINWYVLSQPVEVSAAQIQQFQSFYSDNARHVQPLNARKVSEKPR